MNTSIQDYVVKHSKFMAGKVHGDFVRDGVTYVDVEFSSVLRACQWLQIVCAESSELDKSLGIIQLTGDIDHSITSLYGPVTVTVTYA